MLLLVGLTIVAFPFSRRFGRRDFAEYQFACQWIAGLQLELTLGKETGTRSVLAASAALEYFPVVLRRRDSYFVS